MLAHQLAQINIGRLVASIDDPQIADFVAQLDEINGLAEESPGFVWRLQSISGNATDIPYNEDPTVMVNMSVWEKRLKLLPIRPVTCKCFETGRTGSRK